MSALDGEFTRAMHIVQVLPLTPQPETITKATVSGVSVAWVKARESVELHAGCIADFCEPWFNASAFEAARSGDRDGVTDG